MIPVLKTNNHHGNHGGGNGKLEVKDVMLSKHSALLLKSGKVVYSNCDREDVLETLSKQGYIKTCDYEDIGIWELTPLKIEDIQLITTPGEINKRRKDIQKKENLLKDFEQAKRMEAEHNYWLRRVGKVLRQLRHSRNWTITHVSKRVRSSATSVKKHEAGELDVEYSTLLKYANVYGIKADDIYRAAKGRKK